VLGGTSAAAQEDAAAPAAGPSTPTSPMPRHRHVQRPAVPRAATAPLADRVKLMAAELDLSQDQQRQLVHILLDQKAQVAALWADSSTLAGERIARTQAISVQTGNRIRDLLTDAQRDKYQKQHFHDETAVGAPGGNVEGWMEAMRGGQAPVPAAP
jgi:hypothetical protein